MITEITFKFGRGPGSEAETTKLTPVTVFVGPNNSGKSKILSEIRRYCSHEAKSTNDVILEKLECAPLAPEVVEETIQRFSFQLPSNQTAQPGEIAYGSPIGQWYKVDTAQLREILTHPSEDNFRAYYLTFTTLMLDGPSRIGLINPQGAGDLQGPRLTSLQVLFSDDKKRSKVRRILHDAFGTYFVIDPTLLGQLRVRLSPIEPATDMEERGIHDGAVRFHQAALPIESASDGVKAFAGMITQIVAGDPTVILIDEPEAFLHPPLAFQLGNEISQLSSDTQKSLFVSTHSAKFVMGCIQSGAPVNIVRLTYRSGIATARVLRNDELLKLMRNPLLRSTPVLEGLFYDFVVVTESDTDRAFYQEVNERLLRFAPDKGIPNCLFLHAQNKQTVQTLIRPLRELGIPAAAVVDVDILKEGGPVWSGFLEGANVPEIERQALASARAALKIKLEATTKNMKRDGGINILEDADKESANNVFDRLAEYGLFVVRHGEVESWLSGLGVEGHGPSWLINVFEKMGEDPSSSQYVKPASGDVWDFVGTLKLWLTNPKRKGIPS